jgi:hypothetical protein
LTCGKRMSNVSEIVPLPDDHERATILQHYLGGDGISRSPGEPLGLCLIARVKIS